MADVFAVVPPENAKNFSGMTPYGHDSEGNNLYHFRPVGRKATDETMDQIEECGGTPTFHPPEPVTISVISA